jgi:hypothetical protein
MAGMTASACALASALTAAWATARASASRGLPRTCPRALAAARAAFVRADLPAARNPSPFTAARRPRDAPRPVCARAEAPGRWKLLSGTVGPGASRQSETPRLRRSSTRWRVEGRAEQPVELRRDDDVALRELGKERATLPPLRDWHRAETPGVQNPSPKATFKIDPMNGRKVPESGLWLKESVAPERPFRRRAVGAFARPFTQTLP